ncbi:site-specific integrase [Corallincola holothuriorum]|uniref:Site-specific integrase n=1 Tax=Corallincola holothuriorum TaxID=2282215 RepID=A0A368NHP9_9GAMM|nr:site-specific integrase [Corallincola holothuriorum]RCU49164.1 site-specific integrase [Corallincola holothuriorum]
MAKQAGILTNAEFKRTLAVAKAGKHGERNAMALCLSFYAGLRAKEISSIKIGDVFTNKQEVVSLANLTKEQTKGSKSRTFAVNSKLAVALRTYHEQMDLAQYDSSEPLLRSQKGKAITPNSMTCILIKLYKDAGLEKKSGHSGRRSFLTNLADKGVGIHILKELAGHQNIQTTARYLATSPTKLLNAAELL